MSTFELTDSGTSTTYKLLLMRNPWGTTNYASGWDKTDSKWTAANIAQVPNNVDPTADWASGYFVVPMDKFVSGATACFFDY